MYLELQEMYFIRSHITVLSEKSDVTQASEGNDLRERLLCPSFLLEINSAPLR